MYGDVVSLQQNREPKFFQERAILCPTNEDVNMINQRMLDKLPGLFSAYVFVLNNSILDFACVCYKI